MTLDDFERATQLLVRHDIKVRAFVLLRTPFQTEEGGLDWCRRSLDFAFSIGVECCAIIPTRSGNGAMEELERRGDFEPPTLSSMETALEYGLALGRGRVFIDLWDAEQFTTCPRCGPQRIERLRKMNLSQEVRPRVSCVCDREPVKALG